jgi:hypothetical protein
LHDTRGLRGNLPMRVERKFYLPPHKVELAYGLLRSLARPDALFPAEVINSLYFDSRELDELEHSLSGDYTKHKVRIRWYGNSTEHGLTPLFIELKSRQGFASSKQRRMLEVPSFRLLPGAVSRGIIPASFLVQTLSEFGYFPEKPLLPVVKISYLRFRFRDALGEQSLALDCHIRSYPVMKSLQNTNGETELTGAVLEIKGQGMELPVFLNNISLLETDWTQFSKYSACVNACRDRLGNVGRLSPPGRCIPELPITLRECGLRESDWEKLISGTPGKRTSDTHPKWANQ